MWPDLTLRGLTAPLWAEGRERKGTKGTETRSPREAEIVLGTGTQTQDTVDSAFDRVASLLPLSPISAFCREIFCVHRSHSEPGASPCGDADPSQQLPGLLEAPKPP